MKRFTINGYEAYTNSDLNEGRGSKVLIGYFKNESDAKKAVERKGVMGSDAYIIQIEKEILVFDSYNEYEQTLQEQTKIRALRKLSHEEKRALGLI